MTLLKLPKMFSEERAKELVEWVDNLTLKELDQLQKGVNMNKEIFDEWFGRIALIIASISLGMSISLFMRIH